MKRPAGGDCLLPLQGRISGLTPQLDQLGEDDEADLLGDGVREVHGTLNDGEHDALHVLRPWKQNIHFLHLYEYKFLFISLFLFPSCVSPFLSSRFFFPVIPSSICFSFPSLCLFLFLFL